MGGDAHIWLANALAIAGVVVLRLSWGRPARSAWLNGAGWAAVAVGVVLAARHSGAWGIAIVALVGMGTAAALLTRATFEQPRFRRQAARVARYDGAAIRSSGTVLPALATFAIAGLLTLIASIVVALAIRLGMLAFGAGEANANVAVLGIVPLLWPVLAFTTLMMESRGKQCAVLVALALGGVATLLALGGIG